MSLSESEPEPRKTKRSRDADYRRRVRQGTAAAGRKVLLVAVPGELVAEVDGFKHAHGLGRRDDAIERILSDYFRRTPQPERKQP